MSRAKRPSARLVQRWATSTKPIDAFQDSYSRCLKKNAYRDQYTAEEVRQKCMQERPETPLYKYKCVSCQRWHLTHKGAPDERREA